MNLQKVKDNWKKFKMKIMHFKSELNGDFPILNSIQLTKYARKSGNWRKGNRDSRVRSEKDSATLLFADYLFYRALGNHPSQAWLNATVKKRRRSSD
jgi:hypothetical protein